VEKTLQTQARMKSAAQAAGLSVSRWLAGLVQEKTAAAWPPEVLAARKFALVSADAIFDHYGLARVW
jgi:uncharacterized heparinase superfamily protein